MPQLTKRCGLLFILLVAIGTSVNGQTKKTQQTRSIKRVAKPTFEKDAGDGVFFENVFRDALVGERPAVPSANSRGSRDAGIDDSAGKIWSRVITAATLEDEVKSLQQDISRDLTTVSRFRSDHVKIQKAFEQLSLIFAVIREYDAQIRWKADAAVAQKSFETATVAARSGDEQGFASSKRSLGDLVQLVRGDRFPGKAKPPESLDWSAVVGHAAVMRRLQVLQDEVKAGSSSESEFKKQQPKLVHSAELIALLAETVQQPDMDYADDEGYTAYAQQMQSAAMAAAKASRNNNFEKLSNAASAVGQSCADCHGDYR